MNGMLVGELSALQNNFLILDLEIVPATPSAPAKIIKLGALRPDTGVDLELNIRNNTDAALRRLDEMATGAQFILGHNIIDHDIPLLESADPELRLLKLPVVDTLRLSPLAFPQNPYHRLVKDYKLIRDSLNSPLSDCHSTRALFVDQQMAFAHLAANNRNELLCYQSLLAAGNGVDDGNAGLAELFLTISGQSAIDERRLVELLPSLLSEQDASLNRDLKVCRTRLQKLIELDITNRKLKWPLAYMLAWLRVSGGNSVLAPWVNHQFPATGRLIAELRDIPCGSDVCQYCCTTHDPRHELKRYFGFDDFRHEEDGNSAQHAITLAGMCGKSVLAVLATGGGKSICFQLPALNRHHRNGCLSIVISPLQSLMKDQVDGLLAHNIQCAAALNGLLTMPERADVLEKIQMGDIGILLVSPEQFRSRAFRNAIKRRQIGAWVFDEAHCLSKWGNDFRPDYLYAARFIREFTGDMPLAPIGCFTATGKLDVLEDIETHFAEELGISFERFIGTPDRPNLHFEVYPVGVGEKPMRVHELLSAELDNQPGGAVVFVASRKRAEEFADFLIQQAWPCRFFHAGLQPHEKKDIQDEFKSGGLRAIVATNAFGMGVDKQDVRLVVHVDIPGSLENYLQEAGRAGRDQLDARCALLYDEEDIETQFRLSARSRLSQRDIQQILNKLRYEGRKRKGGSIIMTAGEILQDEKVQTSFSAEDREAETKVVTAISWLERSQYVRRQENMTQVFPAHLTKPEAAAMQRLQLADLPERRLQEYLSILRFLYEAGEDQRVSTDQLMQLTGQGNEEVSAVLRQLEQMGLLENDAQLTLYLRHAVPGSSIERLTRSVELEDALFVELREQAPDADQGHWQDLNLPPLTQQLRERCAMPDLLPLQVLRLLRSLAQDRDGESQQRSSIELNQVNRDYLKLRIRGEFSWDQVQQLGQKRRSIAAVILPFLCSRIPDSVRGKDIMVGTTFGELKQLIADDMELNATIKVSYRQKAIEHVLLYLHMQEVLTLNHGMTVMRRAMKLEVNESNAGKRFTREDFQKLDEHYRERRIQVHVMREYAELGLQDMADALRLVMYYFSASKDEFLQRYFAGRDNVLSLATSEASWRSIVSSLNDAQKAVVTDSSDKNRLILAGPGSGKTRVVVHRIAYLVRVLRAAPQSIIALTFNRHAADEIRQRLMQLIGNDAWGLTVLTYHALAMRLIGASFARRDHVDEAELDATLVRAADLLEGRLQVEGENDVRDRLLRGYRYILVDEYQDIDENQYRLVSALARRSGEQGTDLCLLAVGDDDQNIYQWRGGSNRYIVRFCNEYAAEIDYLVENYRSSDAIISAANQLIGQIPDRLKSAHSICIDQQRSALPPGGRWQELDEQRKGQVMRLRLPAGDKRIGNCQAQAAIAELQRLLAVEQCMSWQGCAILARSHRYLWPIQSWCEQHGVACVLAADKQNELPLTRQREFLQFIEHLRAADQQTITVKVARERVSGLFLAVRWKDFFINAFLQADAEFGEHLVSTNILVDSLYEYARETRQTSHPDALYLGTVHSAKGLEFRHVVIVDGSWQQQQDCREEEQRLYYVAMTRAQETLTLCEFDPGNELTQRLDSGRLPIMEQRFTGSHDPALDIHFQMMSMKDIDIGYAGRKSAGHSIHKTIAAIEPGDRLHLQEDRNRYFILDEQGNFIGRTSESFRLELEDPELEVAGVVTRFVTDAGPRYRSGINCQRWEVVVPRLKGRRVAAV